MFGTLIGSAIVFAGGMFVGWFLFPAPKAIQEWWVKHGWAKKPDVTP